MPSQARDEDIVAVRKKMFRLLCRQMEVLNSSSLTDGQLRECYNRQERVQKVRERLEDMLNQATRQEIELGCTPDELPAFTDNAASA
jgi:hypothetical protein